jgi:hypothetical protein
MALLTTLLLVFVIMSALALRQALIMVPAAGGLQLLSRQLYGRFGQITAATNASPTVITSNNHGLPNGTLITIFGANGNTAINGTFIVVNVTTSTFQIATLSGTILTLVNGNGNFSGTCYWSLASMENLSLKLYTNNVTPAEGDVAGTYTEQGAVAGYNPGTYILTSQVQLSGQNGWTAPATTPGGGTGGWAASLGSGSTNVPESSYSLQTWNWGAAATIYGYFVVGATSGVLFWSERFPGAPINFGTNATFQFNPRLGSTHS